MRIEDPRSPSFDVAEMFRNHPYRITAATPLRCARRRNHRLIVGMQAYFVPGIGWCCDDCAR